MSAATAQAQDLFYLYTKNIHGQARVYFQAQTEQQPIFDLIFRHPELEHVMSILVGGALGGGKTKTMVGVVIGMALFFPGSRIYVCRKDFADLKDTIYKDFAEICPNELIAKPKGDLLERVEAAHDVIFHNGSLIMFRELKDLSGKFGLEVNLVVIEQIEEIEEKIYSAIFSRLRPWMKAPKKSPYIMLCASNPCNTWVKEVFITPRPSRPYHWYFPLSPRKNEGLLKTRPNYIKDLEARFDASWVKKYIDGDWDAAVEGAIFPEFSRQTHVIDPFEIPSHWPRWMALDPHLSKPFYSLYAAQAPGGATFFYREVIGKQFEKSSAYLQHLKDTENTLRRPPTRIIDYSLAGVLHEKNDGKALWNVIEEERMEFKNAIKRGKDKSILAAKHLFAQENPTLVFFFSSCPETIKQISNYQANENDNPAKKQDDHLVDCTLYILNEKPWIEQGKVIQYMEEPTYLNVPLR